MAVIWLFTKTKVKQMNVMLQLLAEGKFDDFNAQIGNSKSTNCLDPFSVDYLKLSAAILQNQKNRVHSEFDSIIKKRLNSKQKYTVCVRMLGWCIVNNEGKYCEKCIDILNQLKGYEQTKSYGNMAYRILVKREDNDLQMLLENANKQEGNAKAMTEYLIAAIYENRSDDKNSEKYNHMAMNDSTIGKQLSE